MARSLYQTLTTPPPRKPPPPKYPLFTKDPFSTTSFGPGQILGLGVFLVGGFGIYRWAMRRKAEAEQSRQQLASAPAVMPGVPVRQPTQPTQPKLAQVENQRGQYGPAGSPGGRP